MLAPPVTLEFLDDGYERMPKPRVLVDEENETIGKIRSFWDLGLSRFRWKFLSLMERPESSWALAGRPPEVDLCTAESFAHSEISSDVLNDDNAPALAFGKCNVRDAFHHFQRWFGFVLWIGDSHSKRT